ncbi:hypothetical protein N8T08_006759 [Aspergillus melleus]|uniref:Uncharacterized protein n=1 Tax=Aspergillus melleus TaxID=138277 RepID=A0ACC3B0I8_9EURO|nr:hypothetical protein N8T08_006759 [Aspergillus melleus]
MSLSESAATAVLSVAAVASDTPGGGHQPRWADQTKGQRDLYTQLVISVAVGLSAFMAFCVLRPKWTELYAARRRQCGAASHLPELPDSFFGWIPVLHRITEEEVLHSAGLDAFVFLSFFKFAIRLLSGVFVVALVIILPIHYKYIGKSGVPGWDGNDGEAFDGDKDKKKLISDPKYLWMPTVRIWYGPFKLRYKNIDAIDYYEEKLRRIDEHIQIAREKEYPPTELAFVTMESIAASQMLVQTILDPHPMRLLARLAPAPADVVWKNTYQPRSRRMMQAWFITGVIGFLTIFWSALLVPFAYLLNLQTLGKVFPQLADALARHAILGSLVQTGLPTLVLSLLTVAVPYLYNWLSNLQGMMSRGDVELSVISKNFFFSFFNLFLVFTVFGAATTFYGFLDRLRGVFKDATTIAFALAQTLEGFAPFYINLIILQGVGLFPFRLLEFGSVALYPFNFLTARTPRDYAELSTPPTFSYGYSIPQTILILVICVVYSVFPSSWLICLFGLVYFTIGRFIYKYQLLYAMNHQQHSTGRAWPMICSRVLVGLMFFQLAMIGVLSLRRAITRSLLLVPLLGATVWFSYFFSRSYEPLMKFIALKSIDRDRPGGGDISPSPSATFSPPSGLDRDALPPCFGTPELNSRLRKYVNPSLILPLSDAWLPGHGQQTNTI